MSWICATCGTKNYEFVDECHVCEAARFGGQWLYFARCREHPAWVMPARSSRRAAAKDCRLHNAEHHAPESP